MKSTPNDENKRSGSAHNRTNKSSSSSSTTTATTKDPLCNLNAASCSPLNEHVKSRNSFFS